MQKTCEVCHVAFTVYPSGAARRYCGTGCAGEARQGPRQKTACATCRTEFMAKKDHGIWQKFCSLKCLREQSGVPLTNTKECLACGSVFEAGKSRTATQGDGYRLYCSKRCAADGLRRSNERACVNCGKGFFVDKDAEARRPEDSCCSLACRKEYYQGPLSSAWKGGRYFSQHAGHGFTFVERPGYASKHMQDHRLAASQALGRLVERGEVVMHINRIKTDNRPENLYLCESMSHYAKIRCGSLPWPTASNLASMAELPKNSPRSNIPL